MKTKFLFILLLGAIWGWGQSTIFSENMGNPASNTTVSTFTGFENYGTLTFVGGDEADVRTSNPSSGYSDSSGNGNVLLNKTTKHIEISNINTSNYYNLELSFGVRKGTNAISQPIKVQVSSDGVNYTNLTYTNLNTGPGTTGWYLRTASGTIPSTSNLRIKFTGNDGTNDVRLDDVKLIGDLMVSGNTVTFHANGGTGSMSPQTSSGPTNLTANTFTRTGYSFTNWNTIADGSGTTYADQANYDFSANMNLYAQWALIPPSAPILSNQTFTGTVGTAFSETPNNTGGAAELWFVNDGDLPDGLDIDEDTGEISGIPTLAGTFSAEILAMNNTDEDTAIYTFNIVAAPSPGSSCFSEDFSDITNGNNTTTGGSGTAWNGNINFPTVETGGAVKLGTGSAIGSIESKELNDVSGDITVKIKVKGWTNIEGQLKVSIDGQEETLAYSAKMADAFEEVTASFTGVAAYSKLKIETTAKRAFIDEVNIECGPIDDSPADHLVFYPAPPADGHVGVDLTEFKVQARNASNMLDSDFTGNITLTKESGPGAISGNLSANAVAGIASFTDIQFDAAGVYTIKASASGLTSVISENITLIVVSLPNDHYRTKGNGEWTNLSSWESSSDDVNWIPATLVPSSQALSIKIQEGNTIYLNSSEISLTNTDVYGTLVATTNDYSITGSDNQLRIKDGGKFILDGKAKATGSGKGLIETGGTLQIDSFTTNPNLGTYYTGANTTALFTFEHEAIFVWNTSLTMPSNEQAEIFRTLNSSDLVQFKLNRNFINFGSGSVDNVFNAVLVMDDDKTVSMQSNKNKTIRGGVIGTGKLTLNYNSGSGKILLGDEHTVPALGSLGNLEIVIPSTNDKLEFPNGANLPTTAIIKMSGDTQNRAFKRSNGNLNIFGTLDLTNLRITNADNDGIFVKNGGVLRTSNTGGLAGGGSAIPSNTNKIYLEDGSTVDYYATTNQAISQALVYYHLIFSGAGIKTPGATISVNTNGSVKITGTTTADFSTKNLASTNPNNTGFIMDGGRLTLGTTGTQPNMMGTYDLSAGVVEFANHDTTTQTIRNSPTYKYQNIEVTGSNVTTSSGNTALRPNGTLVVKNNGVLTNRQNSIRCYNTTPDNTGAGTDCTVTVENGGTFRTNNDKGFNGYDSDFGTNSSAIDANITNITLQPDSTVEYLGETPSKVQEISRTILVNGTDHYANLKISGPYVQEVTGELKVANKLILDTHDSHIGKLTVAESEDDEATNVIYAAKGVEANNNAELTLKNNAVLLQDEDAVNVGKIKVEKQFVFTTDRKEYNFVSLPVKDFKLKGGGNDPLYAGMTYVLRYNEATDYFVNAANTDYEIAGKGFAVKEASVGNAEDVGSMVGIPNNGPITYTLEKTDQGFNVVGNPYPSVLDIKQLYDENDGSIEKDIYFWDNRGNEIHVQQGSEYAGTQYAKFNAASGPNGSGVSVTGQTPKIPTRFVKPTTGFMVQAKTHGAPLNFRNQYRTDDHNGVSFNGRNFNSLDSGRFWLALKTPTELISTTAVVYFQGGDDAYSIDDSESFGVSDDVYFIIDGHQAAIQGKAPFVENDILPVGYRAFNSGQHQFFIYQKEGIFEDGQKIFLKDKDLGITHDFEQGAYIFKSRAGEFNNRFEIVYRKGMKASGDSLIRNTVSVQKVNQQIEVSSNVDKIAEVEIYNLMGRSLLKAEKINDYNWSIPANQYDKQIIVIVVKTETGKVISKKIVNQ